MKKTLEQMTPAERLTQALILALTAPTDAQAQEASETAEHFTQGLSKAEIEDCKQAASAFVNATRDETLLATSPSEKISATKKKLSQIFYKGLTARTPAQAFEMGLMVADFYKELSVQEITECKTSVIKKIEKYEQGQDSNLLLLKRIIDGDLEAVVDSIESEYCNINGLYSPLYLAATAGHSEIVSFLVESGADVNALKQPEDSPRFTDSPLLAAVNSFNDDQIDLIRKMIDAGADVNSASYEGHTLLHTIRDDQYLIAQLLIERGANVVATNWYNEEPLSFVCGDGQVRIAQLLIENGADVNATNGRGDTPLFSALIKGESFVCGAEHVRTAQLLIKNGADVNATNANGKTLLSCALLKENQLVIDILVKAGAEE